MNGTSNETFSVEYGGCSTAYIFTSSWGQTPVKTPPQLYATLVFSILMHSLTCPFTVSLNLLVILAVKCKRRLQTRSNITLACLAASDLAVGVFVQPLFITTEALLVLGYSSDELCSIYEVMWNSLQTLCLASFYSLVLISGSRFLSMKYTFAFKTLVTNARIIATAATMWALATIPFLLHTMRLEDSVIMIFFRILRPLSFPIIIYFHIAVYGEVRRHEKRMVAQQVSTEVNRKMKKAKKGLKTTSRILVAVFLCYLPILIFSLCVRSLGVTVPLSAMWLSFYLFALSSIVLSSFINPLIYTLRNTPFRLAMIQLLLKTDFSHANEIEKRLFGSPDIVNELTICPQQEQGRQNIKQTNANTQDRDKAIQQERADELNGQEISPKKEQI